jgi:hypothetical protein
MKVKSIYIKSAVDRKTLYFVVEKYLCFTDGSVPCFHEMGGGREREIQVKSNYKTKSTFPFNCNCPPRLSVWSTDE